MRRAMWGTTEEYGDASLERCRVFMLVLIRASFPSLGLSLRMGI